MTTEEWRDIKGYEEPYKVSNLGRVMSLHRKTPRILYLKRHNMGYRQVELAKSGKNHMVTVHRLVAEAFIPNPDNLPQVNHIDFNRENNCVSNLEWCTPKQNTMHSAVHGRLRGGNIKGSKRTCKPYKHRSPIKQMTKDGVVLKIWSNAAEAERSGFHSTSVRECCEGKRHTAYGCKWQYANDYIGERELT